MNQFDVYPRYGQRLESESAVRRLLFGVVPQHAFRPFANELRVWRVRMRSLDARRRFEGATDLLINLGSGENGRTGWINVDIAARAGVTCVYDCRKQLPFADDSARVIFAEHFFEHLDYTEEVPSFLSECYRVLAPGAVLRIVVPDAEAYIRAYCAGGWDDFSRLRSLSGRHDPWLDTAYNTRMELINAVFRQGYEHKFAWDYETLELVLQKCGFASVTRQAFGHSMLPELCIDNPRRAAESLYVEGSK